MAYRLVHAAAGYIDVERWSNNFSKRKVVIVERG
jgi:hypothetical protein